MFLTGRFEGCHLDGRLSDGCDVCGAAGRHSGGSAEDWRSVRSLEESVGGKPHIWSGVSQVNTVESVRQRDKNWSELLLVSSEPNF